MFQVCIYDVYGHVFTDEFESLREAQVCYDEYVKRGAEGYELGVELEEVIGDYEDYRSVSYVEWFTEEEWEAAHPWNDAEKCHENVCY